MTRTITPAAVRFDAMVDRSGGPDACWPWTGGIFTQTGYGAFHPAKPKTTTAHRFAYEQAKGPVPDGLHIDHTCHNDTDCTGRKDCPHRRCCNPAHLEATPGAVNVNRSHNSNIRKTHCPRQHPYDEDNTYIRQGPSGPQRTCRACARESDRARAGMRKKG